VSADTAAARLKLQLWFSPSFPVGAFAYSHGLEKAAEAGLVHDRESLQSWCLDLLERGSIRNDLILAAAAWGAVAAGDAAALHEAAEVGSALHPSAERRLETLTQGGSFLAAIEAAWPSSALDMLRVTWDGPVTYPIATAVAAAGHDIGLAAFLDSYVAAFLGNLTSAAIRLSLVGHTDAQRILAALTPAATVAAQAAATLKLDDLGGSCLSADLCSLEHETQYTRLFRS
jgi:urease accessory protein